MSGGTGTGGTGPAGTGRERQRLGRAAEAVARTYLEEQGLRVVAQNWRTRMGEIDLVALDGPQVVFVEVKSRRSARRAHPGEAVSARKRHRLWRLASWFLQSRGWSERPCRFDVVALSLDATGEWKVEWIRDAFAG